MVAGPTASGKSALAHAAARELGGEIVVADPFQRYRGLEIAADSPSAGELAEVPYHAVGDLALTERSTAAGFARLAHRAIDGALARGRVPVVSGGTGAYVRAAIASLGFPEDAHPEVRAWAEELVRRDPAQALAELRDRDAAAAERIDAANPRRLARALEIAAAGGAGESSANALWSPQARRPTLLVGLSRPREELDRRIAARVERELADGLVAELTAAMATPGVSREALQVIGAREVAAIAVGELDAAELPERLAARAHKQLTWLRKTPDVVPLEIGDAPAQTALPRLLALWRGASGDPVPSPG